MGKQDQPIKYVLIKSTWKEPGGRKHQDFQMMDVYKSTTLEQIQQVVLSHAQNSHPEYTWTVEVFDADAIPPGTVPDGTSFTFPK